MEKDNISITIDETIAFLNELLEIDRDAITQLVNTRVLCNEELADHPTVQVRFDNTHGYYKVGIIGILNGLFGKDEKGYGHLCVCIDKENGEIVEFRKTKE